MGWGRGERVQMLGKQKYKSSAKRRKITKNGWSVDWEENTGKELEGNKMSPKAKKKPFEKLVTRGRKSFGGDRGALLTIVKEKKIGEEDKSSNRKVTTTKKMELNGLESKKGKSLPLFVIMMWGPLSSKKEVSASKTLKKACKHGRRENFWCRDDRGRKGGMYKSIK